MEVPAFFYNFGIVGFILYLGPFLFLIISGIYTFFKRHMKVSIDYMMYTRSRVMGLSVVLSCLTGYVYFYVPSMLVVVILFLLFIEEKEKKV